VGRFAEASAATFKAEKQKSTIMKPAEFVNHFKSERASAILRTDSQTRAHAAMGAAVRGGFRIVEFTLTIPGVFELIEGFAADSTLIVGAGTVLSPGEAERAVAAGARFLVSPVIDEEVIAAAARLGVAMMPGCSTPTEMLRAHRAGAPLQKLFPAQGIGPAWVRQTLGPLPFLNIVPTAGVTQENAAQYLQAGAAAVGFVNSLFDPDDVRNEDWPAIEDRARRMLESIA
jgi:Entner-Doudoroff aldolase